MATMAALDIPRLRLRNQQIAQQSFTTPAEVVAHLGAVQSQDYAAGVNDCPSVNSVTRQTEAGPPLTRSRASLPSPNGPPPSRSTPRTDSVHSDHRSTSTITAQTASGGALIWMVRST